MRWPGTAIWPNMSNLRFLSFMLTYTDRPSALFPRREKIFTFRESVGVMVGRFGHDRIGHAPAATIPFAVDTVWPKKRLQQGGR